MPQPSSEKTQGGLYLDSREGLLQGGDSGPAVNLQNPSASLLLEAIHYDNVDLQMPPDSRLQERDIEHLERWVQMGLPWTPQTGSLAVGEVGESFNLEKRRSEHWAWKPVQPSQPPEVQEAQWVKQPIDAFLKHRLEEEGASAGIGGLLSRLVETSACRPDGSSSNPGSVGRVSAGQGNGCQKEGHRSVVGFHSLWRALGASLVGFGALCGDHGA